MKIKPFTMKLMAVGVGLLMVTLVVYIYENQVYDGDFIIAGKLIASRNTDPVLCYLELSDNSRIWIPLSGMSQGSVADFTGKAVEIHYSRTATGNCKLISIAGVHS
jgi:hypothetical protein